MMKTKGATPVLITLMSVLIIGFVLIQVQYAFSQGKKPRLYQSEKLAQLDRGIFLENLVWDHEGKNLYITNNTEGTILRYSHEDKTLSEFAKITVPVSAKNPEGLAHPFGIAIDEDGTIYVGAVRLPLTSVPDFMFTNAIYKIDKQGNWSLFMEVPNALLLNGWTYFQPGVFLICDAYLGVIWKLDVEQHTITEWASDPLLTTPQGEKTPGANGIKLYKNFAFVSSSFQAKILRIPIGKNGHAGRVEIYKDNIMPDDFCISKSGNIYATTHPENVIYLAKKQGEPEIIVGEENWWIKGNTAVVFGKNKDDDKWIYVIGDGGVWECGEDPYCLEPTTLTRIYVGEKGYFK